MLIIRSAALAALLLCVAAASSQAATVKQLPGRAGCFEYHGKLGCKKAAGAEYVSASAVSPDGRNVYAASGIGSFGALLSFRRDRKTGELTQLAGKAAACRRRAVPGRARGRASSARRRRGSRRRRT
jgi:hypothetical protein